VQPAWLRIVQQRCERELHRGEMLAELVVQFPRESTTLRLALEVQPMVQAHFGGEVATVCLRRRGGVKRVGHPYSN
jgi:hypothetical protein